MDMTRSEKLQRQIEQLLRAKPGTAEQWAEICALEAELINLHTEVEPAPPPAAWINRHAPFAQAQDHLHAGGHRHADRLRDSGAYDREVVVLHCNALHWMDPMNDLRIEHKSSLGGKCRDISAYAGELFFSRAHFSPGERIWYVSVNNRDGSLETYDIHHSDGGAGSIAQVDAIMRLAYRSNFAARSFRQPSKRHGEKAQAHPQQSERMIVALSLQLAMEKFKFDANVAPARSIAASYHRKSSRLRGWPR